jgi:hypothetical protein
MADENAFDAYYGCLTTFLPGISCAFLTNADESGFTDYTGAHFGTGIVPENYPLDYIYIPTDCHIKRSPLVAATVADRTGFKPFMIVPRFMIERELYFWGYEVTKEIFKYQNMGLLQSNVLKNA